MAKKLKGLEFDYKAFDALRKSPAIQTILQQEGQRVLSNAEGMTGNAGFKMELVQMPTRSVVFVQADSAEAARECVGRNILLKAVG